MMAKNIILFGKGCFLEFINLTTGEEHHMMINNHRINGDGVKCFRGHSTLYIFAYAENCHAPTIYVKSYPSFDVITKLDGGPIEGYKCLEFSDTSLLFSLGEMPHYTVTCWNWRYSIKFAECDNELLFENQIIRCSSGRPMFLAQLGVKSHKVFIWDVFTVCKMSIFTKHEVIFGEWHRKAAPIEDVCWAQDGSSLYCIDRNGQIYTVDRDFHLELMIESSTVGEITPSIAWYMHGLVVSGPNKGVKHYKKTGNTWTCDWSYDTDRELNRITVGKYDKCIALTNSWEIIAFGSTPESQTYVRNEQSNFWDAVVLHPAGEYIVAVRNDYDFVVFNIRTGDVISTYTYEHPITSIADNPEFPCVAMGTRDGSLYLVSLYNPAKPVVRTRLLLTDVPLNTTKYFEHGNVFITGNDVSGDFFILKGLPGQHIEVAVYLELKQQIADYILVAARNMMKFFGIPVTHDSSLAGNKLVRYCIVDDKVVNVKEYDFGETADGEKEYYRKIIVKYGPDRDRQFYLVPFTTRYIELVEIKRGSPIAIVREVIKTAHQLKRFSVMQILRYSVSWCYDGFVFVSSLDFREHYGMCLSHHRYLQGVYKALINPYGNIVVTLGVEGVLAAVYINENPEDEKLKQQINDFMSSTKLAVMFKRPTLSFTVEERFAGMSWSEIKRLKNIEAEAAICRIEKNKIYHEFHDIKKTLQALVTENLKAKENEKLDLLEFYLDTALYNKKQQQNKEDCRKVETYLRCQITAQDKLSDFIIKVYYERMGVQWAQILGIFSAVKATSYCLLPVNWQAVRELQWMEEQRKVEQFLASQDTFEPWVLVPEEKLRETLAKSPALPKEDYSGVAALRRLQEIEETETKKTLETKIALAGAVSQLYIEISPANYKQRQMTTFYQCKLQQAVAEDAVIRLKQSYNRCFLNTRAIKERELYNIKEKNAKLRYIISEYNFFSENKISLEIVDPDWADVENPPELIFKVYDHELPVTPYVSPSEQALLDAKAAEEERIRLLLLADDFRERALMAMMNGVLEIRWEDELKKDVPKPKCMLEKEPEEYNEDDLRAIHEYDEKVITLKTEREKYKSLLDVEFNKVATTLRDSIRKFNQKLYECTKFKFYIDQGMNQENLQINSQRVNQSNRMDVDEKEKNILNMIKEYEKDADENAKLITLVQEAALVEARAHLEAMQAKEKNLEKAYKKEFMDVSPLIQEQAYKLYKKRPKAIFRNIGVASMLNELAKGVITNETSYAMSPESIDYVKAVEHLDMYTGVPPNIDEATWALICKHRRLRIEYEIRLRAAQVQILEGEAAIATFQRRLAAKKERIVSFNEELEAARTERMYLIHNKPIQIVMRKGLVEIPITGDLFNDFEDAILIPKTEIEEVNQLIINAGNLKLKSIQKNLTFRRKMMAAEWEHMKLRMQINDLIEQKKDIENVKFTKEMQSYLKNKTLGRKPEVDSYELEIELLASAYENRIKERKDKYRKIEKQLAAYKRNNKMLDKAIQDVNIDVCDFKLQKDWDVEVKEKEILQARMDAMLKRNQLVQKIQENHNEILVLQTELELLRLRTFPTFKYKVLDEK